MSFEITFDCPLPHGIHARPASVLEEVCQPFQAAIYLENRRNGQRASLRSVLALISADVLYNDPCKIVISGDDADVAHTRIEQFINQEFAHCDDALVEAFAAPSTVLPRSLGAGEPQYICATSVSSGIAEGKPVFLGQLQLAEHLQQLSGQGKEQEWQKLSKAIHDVAQQLQTELDALPAQTLAWQVLKAHLSMVEDAELYQQLQAAIVNSDVSQSPSAAQAIVTTLSYFQRRLACSANAYLQERVLDIQDISARLLRRLYGDDAVLAVQELTEPSVVIAANLTPSDFIKLEGNNLKALVLESGGTTSHTVILARASGIPVLVGAKAASGFCAAGSNVIVDAELGLLIRNANTAVTNYYQMEYDKQRRLERRYSVFKKQAAHTRDQHTLEVAANIVSARESAPAFDAGADGIGLFRTEMLFMDRNTAPCEQEQFDCYRQVLEAAGQAPVIIRTFDVGGDKPIGYLPIGTEENPFLGYRAVRTYPQFIELFCMQLRALVRAARYGNLRVMVPMISCVEEMRWVRETYQQVVTELQQSGESIAPIQLGMMLEVPSAAFAVKQLAKYADFFSIGSNDLAQYFLACDRGNKRLSDLYSNYHPPFIRLLQQTVDEIHSAGSWVGLCGEMAGDHSLLPLLVGLGFDEISMAAPSIARSKAAVAQLDYSTCQTLVQQAIACSDISGVKQCLVDFRRRSVDRAVLDDQLIISAATVHSKALVIKALADNLWLQNRIEDAAAVEEALWQREEVFSTGLGFGIAIPHCKSDKVINNSISLMRLNTPVDWGAADGKLVDTVFMLTIRDSDAGDAHMKIFAQLARKIIHKPFRETLKACADNATLLAFLNEQLELE